MLLIIEHTASFVFRASLQGTREPIVIQKIPAGTTALKRPWSVGASLVAVISIYGTLVDLVTIQSIAIQFVTSGA